MTSLGRTLPQPSQPALFTLDGHADVERVPVTRPGDEGSPLRRDRRDTFNGRLLRGVVLAGPYEIPRIGPCSQDPARLVSFSEAVRARRPDPGAWVHFYEDDYRFERLWRRPEAHLDRLRQFAGVVSPDFSLYRNLPLALKIHNTYRNHLLGAWLQANGVDVIANVRLSGRESVPYALAGVPHDSTLAVGLHGCVRDPENRPHVIEELRIICDVCRPRALVVYGGARYGVLDEVLERGIPVTLYEPDHRHRSVHREAA